MGAYLSEPVTECESEAGGNHRMKYGATSMQGWRVNQEDSHNCIVDYDNGKSFFAVYDGHGGAEVAKYTSEHFPDFMKSLPQWKEGKFEECFVDAFINFDDTLRSDEVIEQLKIIAGKKGDDEDGSEDGEDKRALIEEACMPLEQILKKYGLTVRHDDSDGPAKKKFHSPNLRGPGKKSKKHSGHTDGSTNGASEDGKPKLDLEESEELDPAAAGESEDEKKHSSKRSRQGGLPDTPPSPLNQQPPKRFKGTMSPSDSAAVNGHGEKHQNGSNDDDLPTFRRHCFSESQSSTKTIADAAQARERTASGNSEDGRIKSPQQALLTSPRQRNSKSESEAHDIAKSEEQQAAAADRSEMAEIASDVAAAGNSRTTETPETQTAASSDDEHSPDEDYKDADHDDQDDTTSDGTTDGSSEVDEDDEVEGMDEDEEDGEDEEMFPVPSGDTPGQDSGTTACVAVIVGDRLYCANAGDSRCVLSRGGVAIELSLDHKPEDDIEKKRIEAAGGCISADGRVNGGLNLSRALGDHFYKRNEAIPLKDQMISALPDVRVETLTDNDHFFVLACDGIWNSMTSQEVVDFVAERLTKEMPLQKICEEMCANCLSPSTAGDGTGCDNMTVIIVKLIK